MVRLPTAWQGSVAPAAMVGCRRDAIMSPPMRNPPMNLTDVLKHRYTTKAYDAGRTLPPATVEQLLAALRYSPSSVNSQPWHFIVADDAAGKARVARATTGGYAYNAPKVLDASHVVVLCAREDLTPEYLQALLDNDQAAGRFAGDEAREAQRKSRAGYVDAHHAAGDVAQWAQKQVYIAQGFLLLAAGLLGVDATPMEGFDAAVLDAEFGLKARGLSAQVIVALGHHAETDFNAGLPKSRLPAEAVFSKA